VSIERSDSGPVDPKRTDRADVEVVANRLTVVSAIPLRSDARERLAELLQARVVDIREVVDRVDVVLTPPGSPQLIGMLQQQFADARVIVVELDDFDFGIAVPGPVKRILSGGADAYVLADSLEELAQKIAPRAHDSNAESASVPARELPMSASVDELIAAFLRESVEYSVRVRQGDQHPD
jgi:hypothetical protein